MCVYMTLHGYVKQCKSEKMWVLLEVGRFRNVFDDKPAKWLIAKKEKLSKYTPTTNSYNFAKKYGH